MFHQVRMLDEHAQGRLALWAAKMAVLCFRPAMRAREDGVRAPIAARISERQGSWTPSERLDRSAAVDRAETARLSTAVHPTRALPDWPAFAPRDRARLSFDVEPRLVRDRLADRRREAWAGSFPFTVC